MQAFTLIGWWFLLLPSVWTQSIPPSGFISLGSFWLMWGQNSIAVISVTQSEQSSALPNTLSGPLDSQLSTPKVTLTATSTTGTATAAATTASKAATSSETTNPPGSVVPFPPPASARPLISTTGGVPCSGGSGNGFTGSGSGTATLSGTGMNMNTVMATGIGTGTGGTNWSNGTFRWTAPILQSPAVYDSAATSRGVSFVWVTLVTGIWILSLKS
ncbi:uncharacterized protein PV06_11621 [Exophiala oligosperma]|uniref:Uncharacterized protein n=1 Tax=Exophiala oligosperma TaxID=215243 RepID=A0A0D2DK45_9EURO|nr:uncharacterized protein PV06_11621 [Exophiala oligosperma]KIW36079.1 hypothetical protein PV06_11621 [Exophiala oligosperma]